MKGIKWLLLLISIPVTNLPAHAQILYTDIIPDTTIMAITGDSTCFEMDINQDTILDFSFCVYDRFENHPPSCCHWFESLIAANDTNSKIADSICAIALDTGEYIDNNFSWASGTYLHWEVYQFGCGEFSTKFYPVKLFKNGNYYFGWFSAHATGMVNFFGTITLFDMAINLTPNEGIYAGQTTGIPGINHDMNYLNAFPNPNEGNFTIQIPGQVKSGRKWTLVIFNNMGMIVRKIQSDTNQSRISVSLEQEVKGIYHCLLSDGINNFHSNVIVQ